MASDLRTHYEVTGTRNLEEAEFRFKNLDRFFRSKRLNRLAAEINDYIRMRRGDGAADKTINNELEVLIKMLRLAYENNKLARLPVIHKLKVNNVRQGFFEREMFDRVRKLLPPQYQLAVTVDEPYGWRTQSEVLKLEWRQVDLQQGTLRLDPGTTKNDDGRVVYLTAELNTMFAAQREVIRTLERRLGHVIPYVFVHVGNHHQGKRIQDFKKAWKTACRKAGCPGMRRHDFRRTAVRNMQRAGVARSVAMKITGHRSESVYRRYAIVSDTDLQDAVKKLTGIVSGIVADMPVNS